MEKKDHHERSRHSYSWNFTQFFGRRGGGGALFTARVAAGGGAEDSKARLGRGLPFRLQGWSGIHFFLGFGWLIS
jgi:hypothetical protein